MTRLDVFRELSDQFSLIKMVGKQPIEKNWTQYCHHRRYFDDIGFNGNHNAGIACGPASGIIVLDVDELERFESVAGDNSWVIPKTRTVRTGSGNRHHYFQHPTDNGAEYVNRSRRSLGFDIRSTGGCVVAPGSLHPDTGQPYEFENDCPIAPAPEWLLDIARREKREALSKDTSQEPTSKLISREESPHIDIQSLPFSEDVLDLILNGKPQGERSEAMWRVLMNCAKFNLTDEEVFGIFSQYPIGEKYWARDDAFLQNQIDKARRAHRTPGGFDYHLNRAAITPFDDFESMKSEAPGLVVNGIHKDQLVNDSLSALIKSLEEYGNTIESGQREALRDIMEGFTLMAQGRLKGRYVFPLATGAGKTQSIVHWLKCLHELNLEGIGVAVCASKVEALCDIKRDLMDHGVPDEDIGLFHSYQYDPEWKKGDEVRPGFASLPATYDHEDKQILLITHNRVRGGQSDIRKYSQYRGRPRDLLIWDESFLVSEGMGIPKLEIEKAAGWLKPEVLGGHPHYEPVMAYLGQCISIINDEIKSQASGEAPQELQMPPVDKDINELFSLAFRTYGSKATLENLLELGGTKVRMVNTGQGWGIIRYDTVVPPELENVFVLDASYPVRELELLDDTLQLLSKSYLDVVSYRNVTVHQMYKGAGRQTVEREFDKGFRNSQIIKEMAEVIKNQIPPEEGIIIFTFKTRPYQVDTLEVLKSGLRAAGIDIDAEIDGKKSRFVFLTWGSETSLSQYSYCSNVIFAGVLHRSNVDIASQIAGQEGNLMTDIEIGTIKSVLDSEVTHCLYQAMSRGSSRVLLGKLTKPMNVWLIHRDAGSENRILSVMPDINWYQWQGKNLGGLGLRDAQTEAIIEYLESLPEEESKVSKRNIKASIPNTTSRQTFTKAMKAAMEELQWHWEESGQSLVRKSSLTAEDYGFKNNSS